MKKNIKQGDLVFINIDNKIVINRVVFKSNEGSLLLGVYDIRDKIDQDEQFAGSNYKTLLFVSLECFKSKKWSILNNNKGFEYNKLLTIRTKGLTLQIEDEIIKLKVEISFLRKVPIEFVFFNESGESFLKKLFGLKEMTKPAQDIIDSYTKLRQDIQSGKINEYLNMNDNYK